MRSKMFVQFVTMFLTMLLAAVVLAVPTPPTARPDQAHPAGNSPRQMRRANGAPANPLMPQINTLLDRERRQLADLNDRARRVSGTQDELAVQREIAAVKKGTERAILELQLEHARTQGDRESAARLERAIATLDAPPPAPVHVPRDIPASPHHQ